LEQYKKTNEWKDWSNYCRALVRETHGKQKLEETKQALESQLQDINYMLSCFEDVQS